MFGKFIKEKRIAADLTLREFCRKLDEDPSNWSKIERERLSPPKDTNKLEKIASILGLERDSDEFNMLFDAASVGNGRIPKYVIDDKELLGVLPVFFRTVESMKPSPDEIRELILKVREGY
ncbi:MAG: helix-turn-helix transcriptional regulator [Candidatus Latescibacterota bacterium]